MSTSYVVADLPATTGVKSEPGVDYDGKPAWDERDDPIYPPDGTVQLTISTEHGNTGINLALDQAEDLWGQRGNTIQTVMRERQPAP